MSDQSFLGLMAKAMAVSLAVSNNCFVEFMFIHFGGPLYGVFDRPRWRIANCRNLMLYSFRLSRSRRHLVTSHERQIVPGCLVF